MTHETPIISLDVRDFFQQALGASIEDHRLRPGEATTCYLVDLLCEFVARPPGVDRPMTEIMLEAARSTKPSRRVRQLKAVGDNALYLGGYFRSSLARKQLDLEYYRTLGGTAYHRLSRLLEQSETNSGLPEVFAELANDFGEFIDVLAGVRYQTESANADLTKLYELWLETESETIRRQLLHAGVTLPRTAAKNN